MTDGPRGVNELAIHLEGTEEAQDQVSNEEQVDKKVQEPKELWRIRESAKREIVRAPPCQLIEQNPVDDVPGLTKA